MRRNRFLSTAALLGALLMLATACTQRDDTGATGDDGGDTEKVAVTVAFQGALTGPYNYLIIPSYQAAQIRFDELNADPDFPARVTFTPNDTQGSADQAPTVVQEVASDPDVVAVEGPGFSGESEASGDTYDQAKIPFVTPSATETSLGKKGWEYWYRAVGNDAAQGELVAQFLEAEIQPQNLFIAHDKSAYGQPLATTVRDTAADAGVDISGFEGVEAGASDYSPLISAVKAADADAFFFGGYDSDFAKIVKQARDSDVEIPLMSGDGSLSSTFVDVAGNVDEVYFSAPSNISGDFIEKYNREFGGKASTVPIYAAEGYDVASLIGNGIESAIDGGATEPVEIREGIKEYLDGLTVDNPFQGVAKPYAFTDNHEVAAEDPASLFYFYKMDKGSMTSIGPADEVLGG